MNSLKDRNDYDVVIVGARCAGAATARLLAQAGARVLVVDRSALGTDTLSTHYLMRAAVLQLHRWGIVPKLIEAGTPTVRSTVFHYESRSVEVPVRAADGVDALMAPRRTVLDPLLVEAAREAGAEVRFGARVRGLIHDASGHVRGIRVEERPGHVVSIHADRVVGADGLMSSVARWTNAPIYRTGEAAATTIYGYFEGLETDAYHWYYAHGMAAGAAPTNDDLSTVFVSAPEARLPEVRADRQAGLLRVAESMRPEFGKRLRAARRVGSLRVFPGVRGHYRQPFGPGWALVGDAGYFRDPNTAHGMSDALRDAELLARALVEGTEAALMAYQATRDSVTHRLFAASDELAVGAWDEARAEFLLREASAGMRDGLNVVQSFAREATDAHTKAA